MPSPALVSVSTKTSSGRPASQRSMSSARSREAAPMFTVKIDSMWLSLWLLGILVKLLQDSGDDLLRRLALAVDLDLFPIVPV